MRSLHVNEGSQFLLKADPRVGQYWSEGSGNVKHAEMGKWTCIGVWKSKLTEQEGSLWFLPQNTGVT